MSLDKNKIITFAKSIRKAGKWFFRGLRWLAIVVFGILFVVGLAVKLPWKMLVCLAIVPVAGIFVPKRIQPWVWLSMTLLIAGAWIWVKLPDYNSADWSAYQFNSKSEELQNNAPFNPAEKPATRYEALFEKHDESIFLHPPLSIENEYIIQNGAWDKDDYPAMSEWVENYQPAIKKLMSITQIPQCRFPIPKNLPERDAQLKRLNQMKGWARLLLWSANTDLADGRLDKAFHKELSVLRMAQHLYQQQTLLDQAAAFHIELMAFRALCIFAIEACDSPDRLDAITQSVSDLDTGWAKSWATIIEREKLIVKNIMALLYEVDDEGNTRIARRAMYALQEGLGYQPRQLFFRQHEMNRLAVIGLWLSLPASPEGIADLIDERFNHYSLLSQKGEPLPAIPIQYSWQRGLNITSLIDWFAIERVKYFWALHGQNNRHKAITDVMRIFSALKKYRLEHHAWPETLLQLQIKGTQTLIDPVYGKPFRYQKTGDSFQLYSLGPNDVDDKGVNNPEQDKDDILFWPRLVTLQNFDNETFIEKPAQ